MEQGDHAEASNMARSAAHSASGDAARAGGFTPGATATTPQGARRVRRRDADFGQPRIGRARLHRHRQSGVAGI